MLSWLVIWLYISIRAQQDLQKRLSLGKANMKKRGEIKKKIEM